MDDDEILARVGIDFDLTTIDGLRLMLIDLEKIPIADVRGGRQRTSKDNEKIAIIKSILNNIKC